MEIFFSHLHELKGSQSTAAFARSIGIPQPSMDRYLKGRVPTVEVIKLLCSVYNVSADWLLGLSQSRDASIVAPNNSGAIASGPNAQATLHAAPAVPSPPSDCARCLLMQEHIRRITGRG